MFFGLPATDFENFELSTIVLNSRDWSEIVWLPKISRFKNQICNGLYPKTHWNALARLLCCCILVN